MPAVFQQLQELDDKRIKQVANYLRRGVDIERSVYPIINQCLDGILRAADSIDADKVSPDSAYRLSLIATTVEASLWSQR